MGLGVRQEWVCSGAPLPNSLEKSSSPIASSEIIAALESLSRSFIPTLAGCALLEQNVCKQMAEIAPGIPFTKNFYGRKEDKADEIVTRISNANT